MARWINSMAMVVAISLAIPALAQGQSSKPTVTTGAAAKVTPQSATLLGKVDPNGAQTTYLFQYGPTPLYGASSVVAAAGDGNAALAVLADIAGLAPATTYHYRLVARNRNGTVRGADRVLRTRTQPLGLTLAATPNPVPFGKPTVLAGVLSGSNNAGRQILLQSNPFPYTQGFAPTGNVLLTDAQGAFAFPLLSVPLNTQYRVTIPDRLTVASPIVGIGVAVRVSTRVSATRVRSGRLVRFFGTVAPARPGAQFAVQRQRGANWVTVGGGITRASTPGLSRYSKRIRIRRGGNFRVFVAILDGNFVSNAGRTVRIRRR